MSVEAITTQEAYEKYAELAGKQQDIVDEINNEIEGLAEDKDQYTEDIKNALDIALGEIDADTIKALHEVFQNNEEGDAIRSIIESSATKRDSLQEQQQSLIEEYGSIEQIEQEIEKLNTDAQNKSDLVSTWQGELDTISGRLEIVDQYNEKHETQMTMETSKFFYDEGRFIAGWFKRNFNKDYKAGKAVLDSYAELDDDLWTDIDDKRRKTEDIEKYKAEISDLRASSDSLASTVNTINQYAESIQQLPLELKKDVVEACVNAIKKNPKIAEALMQKLGAAVGNPIRLGSMKFHNALNIENDLINELSEATTALTSLQSATRKLQRKNPSTQVKVDLNKVEKGFVARAAKSKYKVKSAGRTRSFNRDYMMPSQSHYYYNDGITLTDLFILDMLMHDHHDHDYGHFDAAYVQDTFGISEDIADQAKIEDLESLVPDYADAAEELGIENMDDLSSELEVLEAETVETADLFDIADDAVVQEATEDYGFGAAASEEVDGFSDTGGFEVEDSGISSVSDEGSSLDYSS